MPSVVIVVFDGLQPAQVTPELMPNLHAFASDGVTGRDHQAAFPFEGSHSSPFMVSLSNHERTTLSQAQGESESQPLHSLSHT